MDRIEIQYFAPLASDLVHLKSRSICRFIIDFCRAVLLRNASEAIRRPSDLWVADAANAALHHGFFSREQRLEKRYRIVPAAEA